MKNTITGHKNSGRASYIQSIAVLSLMMFLFFSCNPETPAQKELKDEEKKELADTLARQIDTNEVVEFKRESLANMHDHQRQQSFHSLFTQTYYHTKVFIDRYTSQHTASLDRYIDHPVEQQSSDSLEATYYQIGELKLTAPGQPTRRIVVDDDTSWKELRMLENEQSYEDQSSRFAITNRSEKKISQYIYNRSRKRMAEADTTLVVEGGANPMIFGPRKPITDYQRVYCDQSGECFPLEAIVPLDIENPLSEVDVACLPCETEYLHGSYDSLTIQDILATNLAKPLPNDSLGRSFMEVIRDEAGTERELPQSVQQLFVMGLPALESTFEPDAKSPRTGAAGPWQLMPSRTLKNGRTYRGKQQVLGEIYAADIGNRELDMADVIEQKNLVMMFQEDLYRGIQGKRDSLRGDFSNYPTFIKWMKKSHEIIPQTLKLFPQLEEDVLLAWYLGSAWIGGEFAPLRVLEHTIRQAQTKTPFNHKNPLSQSLQGIMTEEKVSESYEILWLLSQLYRLEGKHSARQKHSSTYFFKAVTMDHIVGKIVKEYGER